MGELNNQEITLTAATVTVTFVSPRTGKATFARDVLVTPLTTLAFVSTDGTNFVSVSPSTSGAPYKMSGTIPRLYLKGTNGNKVEVSAQIAA